MQRALTFLASFGLIASSAAIVAPPASANGNCVLYFAGHGTGTEGDPYQVASVSDLAEVQFCRNKVFLQTQDIALINPWNPIATFSGTYDGNGKLISGLAVTDTSSGSNWGLFTELGSGAVVRNVTLADVAIDTKWDRVGALAGSATNATISNVHVNGSIASTAGATSYHGGLLGSAHHSTISDSSMTGTVYEPDDTISGGLVGWDNASTIETCTFDGTLTSDLTGGGIAGLADEDSSISHSSSKGHVVASGTFGRWAGGLVGTLDLGTISDSTSSAAIEGTSGLGGLVGQFGHGKITRSHASGAVQGQAQLGGLVGELNTQDTRAGSGAATLSRVSASGSVTATYGPFHESIGGLVGDVAVKDGAAWIEQSFSTGKVVGDRHQGVGGLIGNVTFPGNSTTFHLASTYARGSISGPGLIDAGGLIGNLGTHADTYVSQSYAATSVPQGTGAGGLVGTGTVEVSAGFWNATAAAPTTVSAAGIESTDAAMKITATYQAQGWDITDGWEAANVDPAAAAPVWGRCATVNGGYPFLLWEYPSNPCPAPTPAPEPTPTPDQTQTVTPAPMWPKTLPHPGRTVVFSKWLTTNAGQRVHPRASFTPMLRGRPGGDVRLGSYHVTKRGKFTVTVFTKKPLKVRITLHAKATTGYTEFTQTKLYKLR